MKKVAIFTAIILAIIIIADIYFVLTGPTISEFVTGVAYKHPIITFSFGVVIGHWLWRPPYNSEKQ